MANSVKWLNTITLLFLCAMIFTLPFSKSAIEIFFMIAFTLWILKNILFREPPASLIIVLKQIFSPLNLSIYLFVLTGAASTYYSVSMALSLKGFFFKLLEGVFLCFIIAGVVNDRKKLSLVLTLSLIHI